MLGEHKEFFEFNLDNTDEIKEVLVHKGALGSTIKLFLNIVVIGILSEFLGTFLDPQLKIYGIPSAISSLLVAIISASPEFITSLKAARNNKMQIPINIAFGASFATVIFTITLLQIISLCGFFSFSLVLSNIQIAFLVTLLFMLVFIFNDNKTHKGEGFFLLIYLALVLFFTANGWMS